ncbi:hypothetical protein BLNAU_7079 [Blattamonas nauphoetae]|uniref:Uncharacterized protein n=1 Tax=Blattamonas nauphoetae TaxID=2049346 RepID=A0ABQ9Y2D2_9EUKA|nr:hypothetical protein BLNAU_7079 [Blattamonas nauphoetae]
MHGEQIRYMKEEQYLKERQAEERRAKREEEKRKREEEERRRKEREEEERQRQNERQRREEERRNPVGPLQITPQLIDPQPIAQNHSSDVVPPQMVPTRMVVPKMVSLNAVMFAPPPPVKRPQRREERDEERRHDAALDEEQVRCPFCPDQVPKSDFISHLVLRCTRSRMRKAAYVCPLCVRNEDDDDNSFSSPQHFLAHLNDQHRPLISTFKANHRHLINFCLFCDTAVTCNDTHISLVRRAIR